MALDPFEALGLTPGRYGPGEVTRRYRAARAGLEALLGRPGMYHTVRRRLEELHMAYATLRDPALQERHLQSLTRPTESVDHLRRYIAAALEDGLLRHSRRQMILEEARRVGISQFQAQLLIAQVQVGDETRLAPPETAPVLVGSHNAHPWARVAGVLVLAMVLFLCLQHWAGI